MPRLFGAMFATAAIAACAFAGTAFAADGYEADGVSGFYDDSYALMYTNVEKTYESGSTYSDTEYTLIDTNYKEIFTTDEEKEGVATITDASDVTDYGVRTYNASTGLTGLSTYSGKTLLEQKYQAIGYSADSQVVFAAVGDEGKIVLEQYARGTSKAIDTLDIAIEAKDQTPHVYTVAPSESFVIVRGQYYDSEADEMVIVEKMVAYTAEGMELVDMSAPEGFDLSTSTGLTSITDGIDPVFYSATFTKTDEDYSTTTENVFYLTDGTAIDELTGYTYEGNNFNSATGAVADKFLFSKTDVTENDDDKMTGAKSTAKLVGKDGKVIATLPEQSFDGALSSSYYRDPFNWGMFADYAFVTGQYDTEYTKEGQEYTSSYTTYLPCKIFDASGNVVKEVAHASSAYSDVATKDKTRYMTVSSYANFDDSVKTYRDSETGKYRYWGSFTTYLNEDLNEIPGHTVTRQNETGKATDEPQAYMLDGTKLYTGGKFAFDQNDNFVQRAGQYVTSMYNNLHRSTGDGGYGYSSSGIRVGSTDAYIATSDNGKFGIVTSSGDALVASEYDGLYSQYNCELAMVKKDGKWYFVDLSGRARAEMFRLYNQYTGEHFYTSDAAERDSVVAAGWTDEGTGWIAPGGSTNPVFRLYNQYAGEHHYTMTASERDELVEAGWTDEGVGWFSDSTLTQPLFREYNPYMPACNHNYTTDMEEHAALISLGWVNEGIAWYGVEVTEPMGDGSETVKAADTTAQDSDLTAAAL